MPVQQESDRVVLHHPLGASAEVIFYGATVISWKSPSKQNAEVRERLFVSSKAALDGSKPVRGGIPVVFPCFGAPTHPEHAKLAQHGFARNSVWIYEGIVLDNEAGVSVKLSLEPDSSIREKYDKPFRLEYVVTLAEHQIGTNLHVTNTALSTSNPLEFQALLHTYLRVPAGEVGILPLQGILYYDKTESTDELRNQAKTEQRAAVDVRNFTDSVYENAPGKYEVLWPSGKLEIRTVHFPNVVVWNPQEQAGSKIGDMEAGGWERFVCVEPGYVRGFAKLAPGDTWIGQQVIIVVE